MRILVVSDSHGNKAALRRCLAAQPMARVVVFLGDGLREVEEIASEETGRMLYCVPGNCDFASMSLPVREETFSGVRVLFTHGHLYQVKHGLETLAQEARRRQVNVVLFGHTHQPVARYEEGIYFVNPGSIGKEGRYAVLDIVLGGVMPCLLRI